MDSLLAFALGAVFGAATVLVIYWLRGLQTKQLAQQLVDTVEAQRIDDMEKIIGRVKESFQVLSFEALSKSTDEFLKLATESLTRQTQMGEKELEGKKKLIDETLAVIKSDLEKLRTVITGLEKDRELKFGELSSQLRSTAEQTMKLQDTASDLRAALAGTKTRGQWGERMAEDVLNVCGLLEGVNYQKQKTADASGTRPDYTFLLPHDKKVNMDVKFPLDNYLRYLETDVESEKQQYKKAFLKDVRNRIKEATGKDYINPEDNTVDYVIVFIPNEQVFAFINEQDSSILDEALRNKVVLCSPITLFAVLGVIRQAVENFRLEKATGEMLTLFGQFNKQWAAFISSFEKLGKKIEEAQSEFQTLTSTRRNQLERPLNQIENLRTSTGIQDTEQVDENQPSDP